MRWQGAHVAGSHRPGISFLSLERIVAAFFMVDASHVALEIVQQPKPAGCIALCHSSAAACRHAFRGLTGNRPTPTDCRKRSNDPAHACSVAAPVGLPEGSFLLSVIHQLWLRILELRPKDSSCFSRLFAARMSPEGNPGRMHHSRIARYMRGTGSPNRSRCKDACPVVQCSGDARRGEQLTGSGKTS
jgi:hypothetical protein